MTPPDRPALPKYLRVAAAIRRQIADGTLRPGQPAPSGAELGRAFGFSTLTCRKALRALIADGLLVPGPSRNARPRVADPEAADPDRDLAEAAGALSAGLAARRHAAGLTQAELAARARVSVTTVGHAETGRTWQSRQFWERADAALLAGGDLLRLHDAYRAASSPFTTRRSTPDFPERTLPSAPTARAPSAVAAPTLSAVRPGWPHVEAARPDAARLNPAGVYPVQVDPAQLAVPALSPAQGGKAEVGEARAAYGGGGGPTSPCAPLACGCAGCAASASVSAACAAAACAFPFCERPAATSTHAPTAVHTQPAAAEFRAVRPGVGQVPLPPSLSSATGVGAVPVGLSRIVIVWTDGTVTTVHAPEVRITPPLAAAPEEDG